MARGSWKPAYVGIHVLDLHEPAALDVTGESITTVNGASVTGFEMVRGDGSKVTAARTQ